MNALTCKAVAFDPLRKFCKKNPTLAEHFYARLSPENAQTFKTALPLVGIPVITMTDILNAFADVFYPEKPDRIRHLGIVSAIDILQGTYKIFARILTTDFIFHRSNLIWRAYYNRGQIDLLELAKTRGHVVLKGCPDLTPTLREFVAGYILGILELCGAQESTCVKDESDPNALYYTFSWK
ncbi:hypothetical protein JW933_00915 [candidate division FCPU426 bacterium]|nr:hypothetical protein [candidate division FCPU426 bacterium]